MNLNYMPTIMQTTHIIWFSQHMLDNKCIFSQRLHSGPGGRWCTWDSRAVVKYACYALKQSVPVFPRQSGVLRTHSVHGQTVCIHANLCYYSSIKEPYWHLHTISPGHISSHQLSHMLVCRRTWQSSHSCLFQERNHNLPRPYRCLKKNKKRLTDDILTANTWEHFEFEDWNYFPKNALYLWSGLDK